MDPLDCKAVPVHVARPVSKVYRESVETLDHQVLQEIEEELD